MYNVNQRIKLAFGRDYGLFIVQHGKPWHRRGNLDAQGLYKGRAADAVIQRYEEELLKLSHWHMKRRTRHSDGHQSLLRAGSASVYRAVKTADASCWQKCLTAKACLYPARRGSAGRKSRIFIRKNWSAAAYFIWETTRLYGLHGFSRKLFLMRRSHNKILLNNRAVHLRTAQVLQDFAMRYDVTSPTSRLHHLDRLLLSIVRAVDQGAQLIVLDDMTKGLNVPQIHSLLALLGLVKERGVALLIADNWWWFEPLSDCILLCQDGCIERKIYDQTSPRSRALCRNGRRTQNRKPKPTPQSQRRKPSPLPWNTRVLRCRCVLRQVPPCF